MKKINKKNNIFGLILKFFDKWLITPITKFILFVTDSISNNDKGFEKILNNRQALVIISLIFDVNILLDSLTFSAIFFKSFRN